MSKKISKREQDQLLTITCIKMYFGENPEEEQRFYQWVKDNDRAKYRIIFALNEMGVNNWYKESVFTKIGRLVSGDNGIIIITGVFSCIFLLFICILAGLGV